MMKNKEITIYELLGFIKENRQPYKVKYDGKIYKWCHDIGDYRQGGCYQCLIIKDIFEFQEPGKHNSLYNMINDTIEILDEENDEFKNIDFISSEEYKKYSVSDRTLELYYNVKDLIENQKKLIERLKKDE